MKVLILIVSLFQISLSLAADDGISESEIEAFNETKEAFYQNCAMCHGFDGVPMLPDVPNFAKGERLDKSDDELLSVMENGQGLMPSWKEIFKRDKQLELLNFARGMTGEKVFEERCLECHESGVRMINDSLPGTRSELISATGEIEICSGGDVEQNTPREELADVVTYLRVLKKFKR